MRLGSFVPFVHLICFSPFGRTNIFTTLFRAISMIMLPKHQYLKIILCPSVHWLCKKHQHLVCTLYSHIHKKTNLNESINCFGETFGLNDIIIQKVCHTFRHFHSNRKSYRVYTHAHTNYKKYFICQNVNRLFAFVSYQF